MDGKRTKRHRKFQPAEQGAQMLQTDREQTDDKKITSTVEL